MEKLYGFLAFAAIVILASLGAYYEGRSDENEDWVEKWAKHAKETEDAAKKLEKTYQDKLAEVENNAKSEITALQVELVRAGVAYDSLHDAAKVYADRADNCAAPASGSGNRASCTLLAHMFKESDTRAGALAETADKAIIAAQACRASYNTIRNTETR